MEALEKTMPADEYPLFADKGYFTIRRLDDFWSGNFSDHTIEQCLMRMLKTSGGMMHGRGITDSTLTKWVHTLPCCIPICDALEHFTGVHTATSEQHKDVRSSTQSRDIGIVADASVNCDDAVDIGLAAASGMDVKKFTDVTLHRKDKVSTIDGKNNTVKVRSQKNTEVCCSTESYVCSTTVLR